MFRLGFQFVLFLFALSFFPETRAEEAVSVSLTLQDAIRQAFRSNRDLQISEQEIRIAESSLVGVQSAFLPKVNLGAAATHRDAVLSFPTGAPGQEPSKDPRIFTGYENENQAGLSVDLPLYEGGKNTARRRRAELQWEIQKQTLRAKKIQITFEVKRLYYGLLLSLETARISEELVDQAKAHYEDVQKRFKEGASSRFDLLQSKAQLSEVMPQWVRAKNAKELIVSELKKILGLPMRETVSVTGRLPDSRIVIHEEDFLDEARKHRPELLLQNLATEAEQQGIAIALAEKRPHVAGSFRLDSKSDAFLKDLGDSSHENWSVGVAVSWPVFDGFMARSKVEEAKARYSQALLKKEDLDEQIALEIHRACLDLSQAESIITSQKDGIEEAREALRIAETSYKNGLVTNLDVLDAQTSRSRIEQNLSGAIYDYLVAQAFLERSMGHEIKEEEL